jgi:DNA-binding NtrC family response regulator
MAYAWPGNVRELRNVTERGMILCQGDMMPVSCLPVEMQQLAGIVPVPPVLTPAETPAEATASEGERIPSGGFGTLEDMEKRYITEVLASVSGNRSQAARLLGISRSTLQDKIRRYGLS